METVPSALQVQPSGVWLGDDGLWSGFFVSAGTPPQNFTVLPATNSPHIYVPVADDCQRINRTDCGDSRGVIPFGNRPSPGFQTNASSSWELIGLYEVDVNPNLGFSGNEISGYDTVGFGSNATTDGVFLQKQVLTAYAAPDIWIGHLGLGANQVTFHQNERVDSLLVNLKKSGKIPSLSFGYTAGASYRSTKVTASLTLGGYDQSRTSEILTIPISDGEERPLTVGLQNIIVTNSLNGTFSLLHQAIFAAIDSSVSELWLPTSVCEQFATAFGLQYHEPSDRYALSESSRSKIRDLAPKLTFIVGDGLVEGHTLNLDFSYAAFDLEATFPIFPNATPYFPIRRAANESQYVIGRAFLQEAYLGVDFERKQFNISQAKFATPMPEADVITIMPLDSTSNSTNDAQPPSGAGSHHLSSGAIAGIVIGAVMGTLLLVALLWAFCRRRSRDRPKTTAPTEDAPAPKRRTEHEIMGHAVGELPGNHGRSEAEPEKTALNELDAKPTISVLNELEANSTVNVSNELEGKSVVGVHELK